MYKLFFRLLKLAVTDVYFVIKTAGIHAPSREKLEISK